MATQRDLSREDLIEELRRVAQQLGKDTVTRSEFRHEAGIPDWQVLKLFDSWTDFVRAAGLQPWTANLRLDDEELLEAMRDAFLEGGGILTRTRFRKIGRHSDWVYAKRWGRWQNVLAEFRRWVAENDPDFPYVSDLPVMGYAGAIPGVEPGALGRASWQASARTKFGAFLNFRGLQHAPINEQGVVFLFGMVALDLGYIVEGVGTGFPDCDAKRSVSRTGDVWERVRIEFEFRSRNFLDHGHRAEDCDVLVCWEHNWSDCPIEVLELRSAIAALGDEE